ncbi:hypothetical protein N431DRAFT_469942 [Stipitochalara longipes BDJ]|nr:hypothetical protein N431DRAFT_469942 [Stipitochalara longipes BDJ]
MILSSALFLLALLYSVNAITITGYVSIPCYPTSTVVNVCPGISNNVCCVFPRGGNQAQGVAFDILYTATIGVFYQSSSTSSCGGNARATAAGYATGVCLNGGTLSNYFGGGAAWFDCTLECGSAAEDSRRSISDDDLQAMAANYTCTSTAIPVIFGWEGEGVWALQMQEGADWDRYNELPVTTDMNIHIENLKAFGAEWYPNARDHPVAAEVLDRQG